MRTLTLKVAAVVIALQGAPAQAFESYITHQTTPYPPSCAFTLTLARDSLSVGERRTILTETITLTAYDNAEASVDVDVSILRETCSEDDRSLLYLAFANPTGPYRAPRISALIADEEFSLRLTREPNTRFSDYATSRVEDWAFFLVDGAPFDEFDRARIISPEQYNGALTLLIEDVGDSERVHAFPLPAYESDIKPMRTLLSGRYSGTWIVEDAADQGFQLAINELWANGAMLPHAFIGWYTFDSTGNPLWITGTGQPGLMGDHFVILDMVLVTGGGFLSAEPGSRTPLPQARLVVEHCDRMRLIYDLRDLDLGRGEVILRRPFNLETAGYACRDFDSRSGFFSD